MHLPRVHGVWAGCGQAFTDLTGHRRTPMATDAASDLRRRSCQREQGGREEQDRPGSWTSSCTRVEVPMVMPHWPLTTLDTFETDTPAASATDVIVARRVTGYR